WQVAEIAARNSAPVPSTPGATTGRPSDPASAGPDSLRPGRFPLRAPASEVPDPVGERPEPARCGEKAAEHEAQPECDQQQNPGGDQQRPPGAAPQPDRRDRGLPRRQL